MQQPLVYRGLTVHLPQRITQYIDITTSEKKITITKVNQSTYLASPGWGLNNAIIG